MSYLRIGSGDCRHLLSGLQTKGYAELWRKFLAEHPPYYNSYASPIDALRTGAIIEDLYLEQRADNAIWQMKHIHAKMNVMVASCDFTYIDKGQPKSFEELKSIWLQDFIEKIRPLEGMTESKRLDYLKKKFAVNYNQVQFQINCTELDEGTLTFASVDSYDDDYNLSRIIEDNEIIKFRIPRDEKVIAKIDDRAAIFQQVKDYFSG